MRSGGVALDGDCKKGGTFTFSVIRLNLSFSEISYCTFNNAAEKNSQPSLIIFTKGK